MIQAKTKQMLPILTIAGSDCSGGAGIQADLKTFSAYRLFGMSVVLSVVAENTARVISVHNVPVQSVNEQMQAVFEDIVPKATKIGMIGSRELMGCVVENLEHFKPENLVIDPVMFAKNGFALMPLEDCDFFKNTLVKFADILTPNIPEAEYLCGFEITNEEQMIKAAKVLKEQGAKNVLVKGGHSEDNANDVLYNGKEIFILKSQRIQTKNTHGTGCTLSSAIASNLALGYDVKQSVEKAKAYVFGAILHSLNLGKGCGPTNHFFEFMPK